MLKKIIILFLFLPILGNTAVVSRVYNFQPDEVIYSDQINDEFNNLVNGVNGIDPTNIVNGSLTQQSFAATSTAVAKNKRMGCFTYNAVADITGSKSISISPPCEIYMDGARGFITATQTINLINNLSDGSLSASSFYYIYAKLNSGSLSFSFSQTPPDFASTRKSGDATSKFISTIRTLDATSDIAQYYQDKNKFYFGFGNAIFPELGLIATPTKTFSALSLTMPPTYEQVLFKYRAYVSGFPAACRFEFSNLFVGPQVQSVFNANVIATGGNIGVLPFWQRSNTYGSSTSTVLADYANVSNCNVGGDLTVIGWAEPDVYYQ